MFADNSRSHSIAWMVCIGLGLVGRPAHAHAEPPAPHTGYEFALRVGAGLPLGKIVNDDDANLSELTRIQVPLVLEFGYKPIENLMIGAYGGGGVGPVGAQQQKDCKTYQAKCVTYTARVGLQAMWSFRPAKTINPWIGLGFGWEYLYLSIRSDKASGFATYSGFELAMAQGGIDFRLLPRLGIGPYASLTMGRFRQAHVQIEPIDQSNKIDAKDRGFHQWLTFGIRLTLPHRRDMRHFSR